MKQQARHLDAAGGQHELPRLHGEIAAFRVVLDGRSEQVSDRPAVIAAADEADIGIAQHRAVVGGCRLQSRSPNGLEVQTLTVDDQEGGVGEPAARLLQVHELDEVWQDDQPEILLIVAIHADRRQRAVFHRLIVVAALVQHLAADRPRQAKVAALEVDIAEGPGPAAPAVGRAAVGAQPRSREEDRVDVAHRGAFDAFV